jgi:nitrate reductase gamma subunit
MKAGEIFWDVVPYVTLAIVVVGTWWRYRYDKFGWTTRSSQLYESRLLRIGSPMFHFGMLVVVFGHVIGLVIPQSWTDAVGLSHHAYHVQAVILGSIAGITTLAGISLLIYRRRTHGPVFMATTVNDKLMFDQILTRRPHRRSPTTMIPTAPQHFRISDQTAKVTVRTLITSSTRGRQQPFG